MSDVRVEEGWKGISRRRRLGLGLGAAGVCFGVASGAGRLLGGDSSMRARGLVQEGRAVSPGRLSSRPRGAVGSSPAGLLQLGLDGKRDGLVYVPDVYSAERPSPLLLLLHGAGGGARHTLPLLRGLADDAGLILVVPDSRGQTWDVIEGSYGPDVSFIDRALTQTFGRYAVDPSRLAVGGFSDGASYALSLGVTNGDLFTHVIAFSPGFMAPASRQGAPALYVSHGTQDRVLPIDVCSRRLVPRAKREGYRVEYREFEGGHTVPAGIAREALAWFLGGAR
jgi:phospholipase/carboxylesterase